MSARGQAELTPSSVPNQQLMRWLQQIRTDVDAMQEENARDGLPYPLRWRAVKVSNTPTFQISIYNPITGGTILVGTV